jgi:hypothetical protein
VDRGLGHRREVECRRALAQIADVVTGAVVRRRLREVDASGEYEVIGLRGEFFGKRARDRVDQQALRAAHSHQAPGWTPAEIQRASRVGWIRARRNVRGVRDSHHERRVNG